MASETRDQEILSRILSVVKKELRVGEIILFGSRADGTAGQGADFDIAIPSKRPDVQTERKIEEACEEVLGLHEVDFVYLEDVTPEFKEHVLKTGKVIHG